MVPAIGDSLSSPVQIGIHDRLRFLLSYPSRFYRFSADSFPVPTQLSNLSVASRAILTGITALSSTSVRVFDPMSAVCFTPVPRSLVTEFY